VKNEHLESLTAPFAQLDMSLRRSREGLGLGLPLVKVIAAAHGGSFRIDSDPGAGARAIITIPASRVTAKPAGAAGQRVA